MPRGRPTTPIWAQSAGWCGQDGQLAAADIALHWVEPVVSPRLVGSTAERHSVLAAAAASSGLHSLAEGAPPFAVPAEAVTSTADEAPQAVPEASSPGLAGAPLRRGGRDSPRDGAFGRGRGRGSGGYGGRGLQAMAQEEEEEAEVRLLEEARALLPGGASDAANLSLYSGGTGLDSASPKGDGSLIIAFMWQGHLLTAPRRRMDSEQALWAHDWLAAHLLPGALQPGWTYLFEAVYRDNTHVISYPFEGLVLLSAMGPNGRELPAAERQQLAHSLGVLAAPWMAGPAEELRARLGCGTALPPGAVGQRVPSFEGWVVEAGGERCKLVQAAFKRAGTAALNLHPLLVWDAVRCGGASRADLASGLPAHMQRELDALQQRYNFVAGQLAAAAEQLLGREESSSSLEQLSSQLASLSLDDAAASDESAWLDDGPVMQHARHPTASPCTAAAGATDASAADAVELRGSPAFLQALHYALDAGSTDAGPMFLEHDRLIAPGSAPLLRGLLLACIPPGVDGSLPGYTPSSAFVQTHAKGWVRSGPQGPRGAFLAARAAGEAAAGASPICEVTWLVLPRLAQLWV